MNKFLANDEVRQIQTRGYTRFGTVLEVKGERCRVYWHTYPGSKPKRTWVANKVLSFQPERKPQEAGCGLW